MRLNWYMPFGKSAWSNWSTRTRSPRTADFDVVHAPLGRDFDGLGYFHCKWHRDTFKLPKDRWPDWVMLRTQGQGPVLRRDAARLESARRLVGRRRREVLR